MKMRILLILVGVLFVSACGQESLNDQHNTKYFYRTKVGEEVTQHSYELKEEDVEGKHLKAVVFEAEGEIIGDYGVNPSWDPGIFNLNDKERLINEQMIKQ